MSSPALQYPALTPAAPQLLDAPGHIVRAGRIAAALALRAALKIYCRFDIAGRENLPLDGSFVMVANHASHLDALCLLSALPLARLDRAFSVASRDYFFTNRRRMAWANVFANPIPFGRNVHLRKSLALCRDLLAAPGNVLILFPEGTRSTTGTLGAFRGGVGSLVAGTGVPVVPCAIQGAFRAWPKGSPLPRPRKLRLVIGTPRSYAHLPHCRESNAQVAAELHAAVKESLCE